MSRTRVYLVRHGEQIATGTAEHNTGLSDLGRHQGQLLGHRLSSVPFAAIHHSPLVRAAETAELVAAHLPSAPVHACDWALDRTPVPSPSQASLYPERFRAWLETVPKEERDEDALRLRAAVEHFGGAGERDRDELVITHNFVIGWFVRHVLDAPDWRWLGLNQANCGLTIVQWETDRPPTLVCFNDVGHLHPPMWMAHRPCVRNAVEVGIDEE